jgi:CDP-diacylglycerol pyrophosphatase
VNSALVKALVDLDSYKQPPQITSLNNLEYLSLEMNDSEFVSPNRFKKTQEKTDRFGKEYSNTMAVLARKKNEEK